MLSDPVFSCVIALDKGINEAISPINYVLSLFFHL